MRLPLEKKLLVEDQNKEVTTNGLFKKDVDATKAKSRKKFVRYKEGAEMYSMCETKFIRMVRDAKAVYKLDKLVLVNTELFEKYPETFRVMDY